jgi:hypothetical protein
MPYRLHTDVEEVATDKTTFWQNGRHLVSLSGLTVPNTPCMAGLQRERGFAKVKWGGLEGLMKEGATSTPATKARGKILIRLDLKILNLVARTSSL